MRISPESCEPTEISVSFFEVMIRISQEMFLRAHFDQNISKWNFTSKAIPFVVDVDQLILQPDIKSSGSRDLKVQFIKKVEKTQKICQLANFLKTSLRVQFWLKLKLIVDIFT